MRALIDNIVGLLTYHDHPDSPRARALREWDEYYGLEAEFGGIYPLSNAAAFFPSEPRLSAAFSVMQRNDRSFEEDEIFGELVRHWTHVLQNRDRRNIEADAEALSNLFLVNARLSGMHWRCVFVTGDRGLARATYHGIPSHLIPEKHKALGEHFSIAYIRHLWAYTSDALIEPGKQKDFVDLFSGLLANWSGQLKFSTKTLEELADRGIPKPGRYISHDSLSRVLAEWDLLTNKSVTRHSLEEYEKKEKLRDAIWVAVNKSMKGMDWTDLHELLLEEVNRVRDRTILSLSDLGVDVIIQAGKLGKRNPPELIFESLSNTNAILKRLSIVDGYKDAKSFEVDLAKIKEECHDSSLDHDDRQESHLKFLVLGAAFASAEKWLIALSHARRAIDIIERSKRARSKIPVFHDGSRRGPKSHMSGREAYFLAAVAQRMLSGNDSDFDGALRYLDSSVEALKEDHLNKTAANITPARFDGERLAIALSRYYLARKKAPSDFNDFLVANIYRCARKVVHLFLNSREPNSNSLRNVTVVNFAVNILQTFVICDFRRYHQIGDVASCPVSKEIVAAAIKAVKSLTSYGSSDENNRINATRLIRTYTIVGEMFNAESRSHVRALYSELLRAIGNLEEAVVTRYDEWRYRALIEFVESRFDVKQSISAL